tara:strand:- start:759 stop:1199 length:441 start_codon:yes stop_codon:yes gene_type:complete
MTGNVNFPINYDKAVINDLCDSEGGNTRVKEFGRSFIHNAAMLFGMGHAADYKFGKSEIQLKMENMAKDIEKKKWEITTNLFQKQLDTDIAIKSVINEILITIQQQSDYYDSLFEPQFQTLNLIDNFRLILLLSIIFVLIALINWK